MTLERLTAALSDRYRIERELGQGGMATVYLAHDVRHSRKVALKVLKPELSAILGAERFLHEIKTTANLQHPHILSLFDSGEAGGQVYYVMPYVEGESLRARIDRDRQLPVEEAIRIAREVADALDYAHQHGVVHRDIKPENILLHGGHAMVADFGIALAASQSTGGNRMTETGMSLGTPHYMSPEQAMGEREITPRADIYALGCVLYEMLTAEPPFVGATAQAVFARVLTEQPRSLTLQRKTVPPHVEAVVLRSLEKLPADRFPSAAEFARALGDPGFQGTGFGLHGTLALRGGRGSQATGRGIWVARGAAILFAGLAAWGWFRPAPPATVVRFGLDFPDGQQPTRELTITPDGSKLVYVGPTDPGGLSRLWVKERDRFDATPLAGTEGAGPFTISPDSRWVAFTRGGTLLKTPLGGGPVTLLADSVFTAAAGAGWLDDGTIVYSDATLGLSRVSEVGGASTPLLRRDSIVAVPVFTSPLPGARGVLFTSCRSASCVPGSLRVLDLKTGLAKELVADALRGWYLPTGHLIYVDRTGQLFAARFDLGDLTLETTPVPVLRDVALLFGVYPNLSFSTGGTMVMQSARSTNAGFGLFSLVAVDRGGRHTKVDTAWNFRLTVAGSNVGMALSPDGRRLAIGLNTSSGDDIWIKQLPAGPLSRLTFDSSAEARPRWSPDGRWVTYLVDADTLERRRADGIGPKEGLRTPRNTTEGIWSPDGTWLIIRTGGQTEGAAVRDILGRRTGDTAFTPLMADPQYNETSPSISPDGRWITYVSNETGRPEVYVRSFPAVDGGKWQISVDGGQAPLWAHSGRELFYVDAARNMMAVTIPPGPRFAPGTSRRLFTLGPSDYLNSVEHYTPIEITPDDRRFLMLSLNQTATEGEARFQYVENWFAELLAAMGSP